MIYLLKKYDKVKQYQKKALDLVIEKAYRYVKYWIGTEKCDNYLDYEMVSIENE